MSEPVPVEQFLKDLLQKAIASHASDILLTAGTPPILRIRGDMRPVNARPLAPDQVRDLLYQMLERWQIARLEQDRELDFSVSLGPAHRFRGNAFWQRGHVAAVLRLIPAEVPTLEALGLPPVVRELAESRQGLMLVTGPTGHGKSTTLAAMIEHINQTAPRHIITVEDPIEFLFQNRRSVIEQREVGFDTNGFAVALRHVLRQAPDVVMIGEMRDLETIETALTAAETGHLVLATLHTNDAPQTVHRIVDVFPPHQQHQVRVQLSMSLLAVMAQLLLPRAEGEGRVLACEVLRVTPAVANLIRENKEAQLPGVIETQGRLGMISMDSSLKQLYLQGMIDKDTAQRTMRHPQALFG